MSSNLRSSFRMEPQDPTAYPHDPRRGKGVPQTSRVHFTVESSWDDAIIEEPTLLASDQVPENTVIRPRKL